MNGTFLATTFCRSHDHRIQKRSVAKIVTKSLSFKWFGIKNSLSEVKPINSYIDIPPNYFQILWTLAWNKKRLTTEMNNTVCTDAVHFQYSVTQWHLPSHSTFFQISRIHSHCQIANNWTCFVEHKL